VEPILFNNIEFVITNTNVRKTSEKKCLFKKIMEEGQARWLTSVITAILDVKIGRITVPGQSGQKVYPISINNLGIMANL
jgi:hypothetical protein